MKIINLPTMLKLGAILSEYATPEEMSNMSPMKFSFHIFSRISPENINYIIEALEIKKSENDLETMLECTNQILKNGGVELLMAYKELGFG